MNHRAPRNVPRPLPPELITSPVVSMEGVLCLVPEPGGRGRWQVSAAVPPSHASARARSAPGKNKAADLSGWVGATL